MPVFTAGKVSVFPIGVHTSMSLAELRDSLRAKKPDHSKLTGGWASTDDTQSNLRLFDAAPPASDPELVAADNNQPEHLLARYYYYVKDAKREQADPSLPAQSYHQLDAIDLLVTRVGTHKLLAVFSTRNFSELNIGAKRKRNSAVTKVGALASFEKLLTSADEKASVTTSRSPLGLGDPDFFLWLMEKWRDNRDITKDVTLTAVNGLRGKDKASRMTQLEQQVDFFRVGLLTSIAEKDELGPVKLAFKNPAEDAKLDIELFVDGGFTVHVGRTHYGHIATRAETRIQAIKDLVFRYVPMLRDLYKNDSEWVSERRGRLIEEAFNKLSKRYRLEVRQDTVGIRGKCPQCGRAVTAA